MKRLTEREAELVAENENLIYWYIHSHGLELSEWYDLLAIELCYTIQKFDDSRGSLSNYYKLRCDGLVSREQRKQNTQKRFHVEVPFLENIHDDDISYDDIGIAPDILHDKEFGHIIRMRYDGYTQQEIAKSLGVSQSYISNLFKRLRKKYYHDR